MNDIARISIDLPRAVAEGIRAKVESGAFSDASAVVREGLELLEDRDRLLDVEHIQQLASGYDAWSENPDAVYTLDQIAQRLQQRLGDE